MVVLGMVIAAPAARAQEPKPQIPLKVQLVVSRYQGEKKISSLPYTLAVIANDNDKTTLRMGVDVPIPATVFASPKEGATTTPMTSYNYRSVGTNIDCSARTIEAGVFKLDLAVEDSSVFLAEKDAARVTNQVSAPSVRRFTSTFNVLLKDGQTVQHTSATDPVSGEVLRIDVMLTVLK
jgi:hypothetical protein